MTFFFNFVSTIFSIFPTWPLGTATPSPPPTSYAHESKIRDVDRANPCLCLLRTKPTNKRTLTNIVAKMSIVPNYINVGNKFGNRYKGGYLLTRATTVTKVTTRTIDNHAKFSSLSTHKYPRVLLKRASFHPTVTKNIHFLQLSVKLPGVGCRKSGRWESSSTRTDAWAVRNEANILFLQLLCQSA